jgi:hypothetical protein
MNPKQQQPIGKTFLFPVAQQPIGKTFLFPRYKAKPPAIESKRRTSKGSKCISLSQPTMPTKTARCGGDSGRRQLASYDDS